MKPVALLFIFLFAFSLHSSAQNYGQLYAGKEDSFKRVLSDPKCDDTCLVAANLILCEILFQEGKNELALSYCENTISLADKFLKKNPGTKTINTLNNYAGNALLDLGYYNISQKSDTVLALNYYKASIQRATSDTALRNLVFSAICYIYSTQKNYKSFFATKMRMRRFGIKESDLTLLQTANTFSRDDKESIKESISFLKNTSFGNDTLDFKKEIGILLLQGMLNENEPEIVKQELLNFYAGRKMNIGISEIVYNFYVLKYEENVFGGMLIRSGFLDFYKEVGDYNSLVDEDRQIGFIFRTEKLYDKALDYFKIALSYAVQLRDTPRIALNNHYLASTYRRMENWDSTLTRAKIEIELGTRAKDSIALGRGYNEAGFALYGLGDYRKALHSQLES